LPSGEYFKVCSFYSGTALLAISVFTVR